MIEVSHENLQGQDIIVLGPYRPWGYHKEMGGSGNDYPEHSGKILDLKQARPQGINYFFQFLSKAIKKAEVLVVVPGHDPAKPASALHQLATELAKHCGCADGGKTLVRQSKIQKLSSGGDRSIEVHLNSVVVTDPAIVAGKSVLLLDDVMTTGHSLLACRKLLMQAGAVKVQCVAMGRTTY
jgi:predicted amidophosphoribosyltransferase